jgi:hypothetical protein
VRFVVHICIVFYVGFVRTFFNDCKYFHNIYGGKSRDVVFYELNFIIIKTDFFLMPLCFFAIFTFESIGKNSLPIERWMLEASLPRL